MLLLAYSMCYLCAEASAPEVNRLSDTQPRLDSNNKNTHMEEVLDIFGCEFCLLCPWVMMKCQNFSSIFKSWNMVHLHQLSPSAEAGTFTCSTERPRVLYFLTSCLTKSAVNFTWHSSEETPPPITCDYNTAAGEETVAVFHLQSVTELIKLISDTHPEIPIILNCCRLKK